jgi:hypothetical protein
MPTEVSPNEHILREPGSLQLDPSGEGVAIDETKRLIASNKVEGTPVYKRDGEQLGNVYTSWSTNTPARLPTLLCRSGAS